jgi:O6-methylguanine-DNA--protein-cysteine methyltransferase
MAANPIPLVIPCHRGRASDGSLHGYAGGREGRPGTARLLALEGVKVVGKRVLA